MTSDVTFLGVNYTYLTIQDTPKSVLSILLYMLHFFIVLYKLPIKVMWSHLIIQNQLVKCLQAKNKIKGNAVMFDQLYKYIISSLLVIVAV